MSQVVIERFSNTSPEFVRRVESLFVPADQTEARCARAKARADNLTQSILSKAFRGELIPNGSPNRV